MKLWSLTTSSPSGLARRAERAERDGWAGIGVTDSQNLAGDAWVAASVDTDIPTPRFVMDPVEPAISGTRRLTSA